jgi:hypothetical protein
LSAAASGQRGATPDTLRLATIATTTESLRMISPKERRDILWAGMKVKETNADFRTAIRSYFD